MIVVQLIVVLVAMGANGVFTSLQASRQFRDSMKQKEEQLLKRVPSTLSTPLWNLDTASIDSLIGLEMMDRDVQAIIIKGDQGTQGQVRDAAGKPQSVTEDSAKAVSSGRYLHVQAAVSYQEKSIGTVDIYLSDAAQAAVLRAQITQSVLVAVGVILLLVVSTVVISRLFVSRPLNLVSSAVGRTARGDLGCTVEWSSQDEIGSLAAATNEMIAQLRGIVVRIRETSELLAGSSTQLSQNA
ncbi:MAG TPA: methyl-accepting chemotaxis protein, partial [Spirochaetia bacterium]|nr:methyl-accepting chemotaxis protein [Spirochaetia bacterium]